MVDEIRVDYQALQRISSHIYGISDHYKATVKELTVSLNTLNNGGWEGEAASYFFADMYNDVLPGLSRLGIALDETAHTVMRIIDIMREAELEAAQFLRGMDANEDGIGLVTIGIGIIIGTAIGGIIADEENLFEKHPEPGNHVVGNYEELQKYWEKQQGNTCGYYATRNILKAFGKDIPISTLQIQAGEEIGDEGTVYEDYAEMFEANGVPVDSHQSFSSREEAVRRLEQDIQDNKGILARINVAGLDEHWPYYPSFMGGHAVWVTGLRYDDDGNLTHVICNDSAKGAGIEYPAAEFLDAWQGREYSYIATKDAMTEI